jgi:hypothetical protein
MYYSVSKLNIYSRNLLSFIVNCRPRLGPVMTKIEAVGLAYFVLAITERYVVIYGVRTFSRLHEECNKVRTVILLDLL